MTVYVWGCMNMPVCTLLPGDDLSHMCITSGEGCNSAADGEEISNGLYVTLSLSVSLSVCHFLSLFLSLSNQLLPVKNLLNSDFFFFITSFYC